MPQTILSVVLEVVPESAGLLSSIIEKVKAEEDVLRPGDTEAYSRLKWGVPTLHFMSMSVFQDRHYDPVLVIEANFDGPPGPFWGQLEATYGDYLRSMLRCCKRPSDRSGPLYDAVTEPGSRYPIAPYLERKTLTPSAFHQGNRGMGRHRIMREQELFKATRIELAQADPAVVNPYRGMAADKIHRNLRAAMVKKFPWLETPEPPRISRREATADLLRLTGYALFVVFVLSLPGYAFLSLLAAFHPGWGYGDVLFILIVSGFAGILLWLTSSARRGEAAPTRSGNLAPSTQSDFTSPSNTFTLIALVVVGLVVVGALMAAVGAAAKAVIDVVIPKQGLVHALMSVPAVVPGWFDIQSVAAFLSKFAAAFCRNWWPAAHVVGVGIFAMLFFSIPVILLWLRWLERRDSHHDAPPVDQRELRKMTRREDRIPQNHMGSVVLVKPGVLRTVLFRIGHHGLGLLLRVIAKEGYLGSMRTIHFAHWAFIDNGSRLMFFSNFDSSWDNYLDDFIEKAHGGLSLAWSSCVGFPATRFLVQDGASHGRQFKAWARHSMAVSRFWFSAYKELTVNQIERNGRIADGLRKASLNTKEAAEWARDL
jgi:hypothetical protein